MVFKKYGSVRGIITEKDGQGEVETWSGERGRWVGKQGMDIRREREEKHLDAFRAHI